MKGIVCNTYYVYTKFLEKKGLQMALIVAQFEDVDQFARLPDSDNFCLSYQRNMVLQKI